MHFKDELLKLSGLDFSGKGEDFVRERFLSPLLEILGYKVPEYEVIRSGDDNSSFKLHYPPVEHGAKKVKHYNPDYIPTMRKKAFWVIDAKSPKEGYPFPDQYKVQGMQYAIHPEIRANYLILSNGKYTDIYNASLVFLLDNGDLYTPLYSFNNSELIKKWDEIRGFLAPEKIRVNLEDELKNFYEKVASSSFNKDYPVELKNKITINTNEISRKIQKRNYGFIAEKFDQSQESIQQKLYEMDLEELFKYGLNWQLGTVRTTTGRVYADRALQQISDREVFNKLIDGNSRFSIFRKQQVFIALCVIYQRTKDSSLKIEIENFLRTNMSSSLREKTESLALGTLSRATYVLKYPNMRKELEREIERLPEYLRYTDLHSVAGDLELLNEEQAFNIHFALLNKQDAELEKIHVILNEFDKFMQSKFSETYKSMDGADKILGGGTYSYYENSLEIFLRTIVQTHNIVL